LCYLCNASLLHLKASVEENVVDHLKAEVLAPDCGPCPTLNCPKWQQHLFDGKCCPTCQTCLDGSAPVVANKCPEEKCPAGSFCQGFVIINPDGSHDSFGVCCNRKKCLDGSPPVVDIDCSVEQKCPDGSYCQGFVDVNPDGSHDSYGVCCRRKRCLDGSPPVVNIDCSVAKKCPDGSYCQGFVDVNPDGSHDSYGVCCKPRTDENPFNPQPDPPIG